MCLKIKSQVALNLKYKCESTMKRSFDIFLALTLSIVLLIPMLMLAIGVRVTSHGPVLYLSDRVGQYNRVFKMLKFRSMNLSTPVLGSHLLENPDKYLTSIGSFLRKWSLDELPQIWNILKGDMSFVGPRPALFNQEELITLRTEKSIDRMIPGLTGWAQINGRDELSIHDKVNFDHEYMLKQSFNFDLKILWLTYLKVVTKDSISH